MKLRFVYLYIAFIVSLVMLISLSFLFYKRLNAHFEYSQKFAESYSIILAIRQLEGQLTKLESYSRGYMLSRDSSFLPLFYGSRDSVGRYVDTLAARLARQQEQTSKFLLMRSTITNQVNLYNHNIERAGTATTDEVRQAVLRGESWMANFRSEAAAIEQREISQRRSLRVRDEYFEDFYPSYFNSILIWSGIVTLVSFFFINREVRMRSRYQVELEKKLQELNRSNSELRQFAYIASHDLQEPLRKIRTFSDKLNYKYGGEMDDDMQTVIKRIQASAKRMQELIQDMINFTSLVSREEPMSTVDLNRVITNVLADFAEQSRERHAIITWDQLPVVNGSEAQLVLLFKSLFDNAFKFAKPGESPDIRISHEMADGDQEAYRSLKGKQYHKIVMEDRGIGFNNAFAEKIFMIFQRLHTQQSGYRGKGIGLAIAQRIMTNHNGVILARGMINDGATFIMYFPAG